MVLDKPAYSEIKEKFSFGDDTSRKYFKQVAHSEHHELLSKVVSRSDFRYSLYSYQMNDRDTLQNRDLAEVKLHSYSEIVHGFAAHLTDEEAAMLQSKQLFARILVFLDFRRSTYVFLLWILLLLDDPGVLAVMEDIPVKGHTTRSYSFLGLDYAKSGIWKKTTGIDTIIGVIDTGDNFFPRKY